MITIIDRDYKFKCQLDYSGQGDLTAYDDWYESDLETGMSNYSFSVDKTNDNVSNIQLGYYCIVRDGDIMRLFEIADIEQDSQTKHVYCEDGGLDLISEQVFPMKSEQSHTIHYYFFWVTEDSGWEIGINEIPNTRTRKLEWDGTDTQIVRLKQLANRFDAEIDFSFEFNHDGTPKRKLVNFYNKLGRDNKVRLEYGQNVTKITKKENIMELATGIQGVGANDITLEGYTGFDGGGRYKHVGRRIYDLQEGKRWGRRRNDNDPGYIIREYTSTAETQQELAEQMVNQLKKWAYPSIEYTVEVSELPERLNCGDTVTVIDHDYKPSLVLESRVSKVKRRISNDEDGVVTLSSHVESIPTADDRLRELAKTLKQTQDTIDEKVTKTIQNMDLSNIQGLKGDKGDSLYTWVVFADDENGNGLSLQPLDKRFIGFAYNKETQDPVMQSDLYVFVSLTDRSMLEAIEIATSQGRDLSNKVNGLIEVIGHVSTKEDLQAVDVKLSNLDADYKRMLNNIQQEELPRIRAQILENIGEHERVVETINKFIRMSDDGIAIGEKAGSLEVKIDNNEMAFYDGGKKVMYINNQLLYIASGIFVSSLQVANHVMEKMVDDTIWTIIRPVGGIH